MIAPTRNWFRTNSRMVTTTDRSLVEDSFLTIGSGCLKRRWSGFLQRGPGLSVGLLRLADARQQTVTVMLVGPGPRLLRTDEIRLTPTRPHFGGVRWWFRCPGCGRRCGKLYVPRVGDGPGCRRCHGLAYRQSVEHDHRVDELVREPAKLEALIAGLERGDGPWTPPRASDTRLAMKAVERLTRETSRDMRRAHAAAFPPRARRGRGRW